MSLVKEYPDCSSITNIAIVYFLYPETCGVRLEEMDTLFGDASTIMGTPSIHDESNSLFRGGSPIGSARGRPGGGIPDLSLGAALDDDDDRKSQIQTSGGEDRSVGAWLSRVVGRGRDSSQSSGQGRYAPLGQQEDGNRNDG